MCEAQERVKVRTHEGDESTSRGDKSPGHFPLLRRQIAGTCRRDIPPVENTAGDKSWGQNFVPTTRFRMVHTTGFAPATCPRDMPPRFVASFVLTLHPRIDCLMPDQGGSYRGDGAGPDLNNIYEARNFNNINLSFESVRNSDLLAII